MKPIVEKYIKEQKDQAQAQVQKERDAFLMRIGMTEKQYQGPDDEPYDFTEYDEKKDTYYRTVPIKVTDEEYQALKEAHKLNHKPAVEETESSALPGVLLFISVCTIIAGIIMGIVNGDEAGVRDFAFSVAMETWGSYGFSAILILCIRRVIVLLEQIRDK